MYVSNNTGYLFKSVDGGNSFSFLTKLENNNFAGADIHFIDTNTGYVSVGKRIFKTMDGGTMWTVVVALGDAFIFEIHFTDATHG